MAAATELLLKNCRSPPSTVLQLLGALPGTKIGDDMSNHIENICEAQTVGDLISALQPLPKDLPISKVFEDLAFVERFFIWHKGERIIPCGQLKHHPDSLG